MESYIKVRTTIEEINREFQNSRNSKYYIKYFDGGKISPEQEKDEHVFNVLLRHNESIGSLKRPQPYNFEDLSDLCNVLAGDLSKYYVAYDYHIDEEHDQLIILVTSSTDLRYWRTVAGVSSVPRKKSQIKKLCNEVLKEEGYKKMSPSLKKAYVKRLLQVNELVQQVIEDFPETISTKLLSTAGFEPEEVAQMIGKNIMPNATRLFKLYVYLQQVVNTHLGKEQY